MKKIPIIIWMLLGAYAVGVVLTVAMGTPIRQALLWPLYRFGILKAQTTQTPS